MVSHIYIYIVLVHGASDRSFDIVYFVFFIWIIIKIIKFSSILKRFKRKNYALTNKINMPN